MSFARLSLLLDDGFGERSDVANAGEASLVLELQEQTVGEIRQ